MAWPMIYPAPVVTAHTGVCRDVCGHQGQVRPVQPDLTGRIVLPNQRLAHRARGLLDSADHTHRSRVLSEAPWREDAIHHRRIRLMRHQTTPHRRRRRESVVVLAETRCEQVGRLLDEVDRPDHPRDGTDPLAHKPVTSVSVSGPGRLPLDLRLDRRDEELTPWAAAVAQHVPDATIPTDHKARPRLHPQVAPGWRPDPACRARHEPCRTTIALAIALIEEAIRHHVPLGVVVFDAWSLAEDVLQVWARRRQDRLSRLNTNRLPETASVLRRDANGWTLKLPGPHRAVEALVPLIPATASRPVNVGEHTDGGFTLAVRLPGWGQVRRVVSGEPASLTGRSVVRVTNRPDWRAATIRRRSSPRWPTDTCDQDGTGHRGFHASRRRSAEAMGQHWCLVCVASSLRHLTCLPTGPGRTQGLIRTLGDACRHQGRALLPKRLVFVHDQ